MTKIQPELDAQKIRELNDALRTCRDPIGALIMNGSLVMTQSIAMRGEPFITNVLTAIASFNDFTPENDPHGEHDMAFVDVDGERIFFKVDYYDEEMRGHSSDPGNPEVTRRVLTIGLASEY